MIFFSQLLTILFIFYMLFNISLKLRNYLYFTGKILNDKISLLNILVEDLIKLEDTIHTSYTYYKVKFLFMHFIRIQDIFNNPKFIL